MGGSSSQPTQSTVTTAQMSPEQRQLFELAVPGVKQFAAQTPTRVPNQVSPFDPAQVQGQEMALGTAPEQAALAGNAAQTSTNLLNGTQFDASRGMLRDATDAAVRPITEAYQQDTLPGIRDDFQSSGQGFGGSRRAITDARATNDYFRNVGDTSAKIQLGAYNTNVDAMVKALGLAPQTTQNLLAPALTTSGVGDIRQNLSQQQLNDIIAASNFTQMAPFLQSQDILSLLTGIPGGTTTSNSVGNVPQTNVASKALGGAAAGASLGSALFPGVGTAAGAGLGGLLAFL